MGRTSQRSCARRGRRLQEENAGGRNWWLKGRITRRHHLSQASHARDVAADKAHGAKDTAADTLSYGSDKAADTSSALSDAADRMRESAADNKRVRLPLFLFSARRL